MGAHSPNFNHVIGEVKILLTLIESKRSIFSVASMQQFGVKNFALFPDVPRFPAEILAIGSKIDSPAESNGQKILDRHVLTGGIVIG